MANRNTGTGGATNFTEEGLKPTDLNDTFSEIIKYLPKFYTDETGGSSTSGSDTTIATVTIGTDALGSSATLDIRASIRCDSGSGAGATNNFTYKIKVNGTQVESTTLKGDNASVLEIGGYLSAIETGVDNSTPTTVTVTVARAGTATNTGYCNNLTVIGYRKTL